MEGLSDQRIGSSVSLGLSDKSLVAGEESWNGNTLQQKFQATAVGPANVNVAFQFGDMTQSQAIKDTVQAHVEMPKGDFLAKTGEATAMIQTADQKATAWMDSLAAAYSDAWNNHTGALKHQADFERLMGDLILGAALAFVPGGIGGVIGKTMANATKSEAFICDGVKDLTKWGFRNAAPALLKGAGGGGDGLTAYPTDPFMWDKLRGIRIHSELGVAAARNEAWIHAVNSNDPNFTLDFDPADVMKQALTVDGTDLRSVSPVDIQQQSLEFEKGFWAKWLELYGYNVVQHTVKDMTTSRAQENAGKYVKKRCEAVGLDITPYMEASRRAAQAQANKENAFP